MMRSKREIMAAMDTVRNFLRIYRWRGLSDENLLNGTPDPRETTIALIQLAALARKPSHLSLSIPVPLYIVLTSQVTIKGQIVGDMNDPQARALFLSDLYDYIKLYKRFHCECYEYA